MVWRGLKLLCVGYRCSSHAPRVSVTPSVKLGRVALLSARRIYTDAPRLGRPEAARVSPEFCMNNSKLSLLYEPQKVAQSCFSRPRGIPP